MVFNKVKLIGLVIVIFIFGIIWGFSETFPNSRNTRKNVIVNKKTISKGEKISIKNRSDQGLLIFITNKINNETYVAVKTILNGVETQKNTRVGKWFDLTVLNEQCITGYV